MSKTTCLGNQLKIISSPQINYVTKKKKETIFRMKKFLFDCIPNRRKHKYLKTTRTKLLVSREGRHLNFT